MGRRIEIAAFHRDRHRKQPNYGHRRRQRAEPGLVVTLPAHTAVRRMDRRVRWACPICAHPMIDGGSAGSKIGDAGELHLQICASEKRRTDAHVTDYIAGHRHVRSLPQATQSVPASAAYSPSSAPILIRDSQARRLRARIRPDVGRPRRRGRKGRSIPAPRVCERSSDRS
jgi:hypothetical protein